MIHRLGFRIGAILLLSYGLFSAECSRAASFELTPAAISQPRGGLGNVLAKLAAGKEVCIAYFGGSITAANGWRPKTTAWFQQQFPKATIREIHAAIGGTGSELGVFRYQQDVLAHKPDLVFVEFSVNDGGASPEPIYRAMEGIVRQTWRADPAIDLCFVYTFRVGYEKELDQGLCPPATSAHEHVAAHYGIPSINVALRVTQMAREGKLIYKVDKNDKSPQGNGKLIFSNDGVHPLDAGHEVYLQVIRETVVAMQAQSKAGAHELKTAMRADNWERAKLVPLNEKMLHGSWHKMDDKQGLGKSFGNRLPAIWEGSTPGDRIEFRFKGTMIGIYDLVGPDGGQLVCTVDGVRGRPRPRFDSYCSYHRLAALKVADGLEDKEHKVALEIDPEQPDRSSVLKRVRNEPKFDPKRYDGTKAWVGFLDDARRSAARLRRPARPSASFAWPTATGKECLRTSAVMGENRSRSIVRVRFPSRCLARQAACDCRKCMVQRPLRNALRFQFLHRFTVSRIFTT